MARFLSTTECFGYIRTVMLYHAVSGVCLCCAVLAGVVLYCTALLCNSE